ncbi:Sugar fermentation stimulation protein A [compost metagenome]
MLFVVQMKGCHAFTPYREMDPAFADALEEASRQGVRILAYEAIVTEQEIVLDGSLPVRL